MRESKIEKHLKKAVKKAGGIAYKWVSPNQGGVPDEIVFFPGLCFLVELKSSIGKLSPLQKAQHRRLAAIGFDVVVLNSIDAVDEWVAMQKGALRLRFWQAVGESIVAYPRNNALITNITTPCED